MGEPEWPNFRRAFKLIHLDNVHTIIATDGLSDPFMKDHAFYESNKNGFGLELYIEITEKADVNTAAHTWGYNLLSQMAYQITNRGSITQVLDANNGFLSAELDGSSIDAKYRHDDKYVPVIIGVPSESLPRQVEGPLSPIRFVSITLLTPGELQAIKEKGAEGRREISEKLQQTFGGPVSLPGRESVV